LRERKAAPAGHGYGGSGRLGGKEFEVILVSTGKPQALEVAEDLRQALKEGSQATAEPA
jgi:GGDEF domain-containing protein